MISDRKRKGERRLLWSGRGVTGWGVAGGQSCSSGGRGQPEKLERCGCLPTSPPLGGGKAEHRHRILPVLVERPADRGGQERAGCQPGRDVGWHLRATRGPLSWQRPSVSSAEITCASASGSEAEQPLRVSLEALGEQVLERRRIELAVQGLGSLEHVHDLKVHREEARPPDPVQAVRLQVPTLVRSSVGQDSRRVGVG